MYEILSDDIIKLKEENMELRELLILLLDSHGYGCDECEEHVGCWPAIRAKIITKRTNG